MMRQNPRAAGDVVVRPVVHLFNGFQNPCGGSELEALSLYTLLKQKADVALWATSSKVSPLLLQQFPIRRIALRHGAVPRGGTYVFVGAHWRNKLWPYVIPKPRRLIYIYNTFHPKIVRLTSTMPRLLAWPNAEYVVISNFQNKLLDIHGEVHPSPIDIALFHPVVRAPDEQLVIGRMSRDAVDKHHPDDISLYQELARLRIGVHLQGASCLASQLGAFEGIDLAPEGAMPAPAFLASLDIFYYRTWTHVETFGRVVFEAMACGLPVVCHFHGGYADWIRHGENGFLFDTTDEARAILARLAGDAALRARVGAAARRTVEGMYSTAGQDTRLRFYLS